MTNNDLLIRLRYALDIKNTDMIEIFKLGGMTVSKEELFKILTKPEKDEKNRIIPSDDYKPCNDKTLEAFLNGFVTFKRGKREDGQDAPPASDPKEKRNNLFLKKIKIALSLTTDDIIDIFKFTGFTVSKSELGAIMRKPDHRNYKECMDSFVRQFLKGLTIKYRGEQS